MYPLRVQSMPCEANNDVHNCGKYDALQDNESYTHLGYEEYIVRQ